MNTLYGIASCDTMKKARNWLDMHNVVYRFHDYKKEGLEAQRFKDWVNRVGFDILLNRNGTTFRALPDEDKQNIDEPRAIALMLGNLSMIKRPVFVYGDRICVGFKPEIYEGLNLTNI